MSGILFIISEGSLSCRAVGRCSGFRGNTTGDGAGATILGGRLRGPSTGVVVAAVRGLSIFVGGGGSRRTFRGGLIVVFSRYRHSRFNRVRATVAGGFGHCCLFKFAKAPVFTTGTITDNGPGLEAARRTFNRGLRACAVISTVTSGGILPFEISCVDAVGGRRSVGSTGI